MADRALVIGQLAELFRTRGFAATSLPEISQATGLGKGSLYHLFPGGKAQMLTEVVADVTSWFEQHIFAPLDTESADVSAMFHAVTRYFDSGKRLCLIGRIGLEPDLEALTTQLSNYFTRWQQSLADALQRTGATPQVAAAFAEEVIVGIQGSLILAHTTGDTTVFLRTIERLRGRLDAGV